MFDERLRSTFNAKVVTLWPFGPQVFICNQPISGVADLAGLKVRSFTPSMSAMLEHFRTTPVTLQFSEVYPALGPEVTTHFLPLSVSVQGHFIILDA